MYGSVLSPELTLRWFARRARLPFSHKLLAMAACTTVLALAACGGARTVERQDELRGVWLSVRALGAEAAHGVGEGELPDRRARDHVVGAASCSEVSCNSSVRYATELMSRRPLAHQTREFCCMQMQQGRSLSNCMGEAQIDAVGLRRRIRLRGLLVRELRELMRIEVAGAMPADVVGTMLRSALVLDLY